MTDRIRPADLCRECGHRKTHAIGCPFAARLDPAPAQEAECGCGFPRLVCGKDASTPFGACIAERSATPASAEQAPDWRAIARQWEAQADALASDMERLRSHMATVYPVRDSSPHYKATMDALAATLTAYRAAKGGAS